MSEAKLYEPVVNDKLFPVAAQLLGAIRASQVDSIEVFVEHARHGLASNLKEAAETRKKLLQLRVDEIVNPITVRLIDGTLSAQGTYHWMVPAAFDKSLSLVETPRWSRQSISDQLSEMVEEMQPVLDKIYEGSGIKVQMHRDQTSIDDGEEVFVYLKHKIDSSEFLNRNGITAPSGTISNTIKSIKNPTPKRKRGSKNDDDGDL